MLVTSEKRALYNKYTEDNLCIVIMGPKRYRQADLLSMFPKADRQNRDGDDQIALQCEQYQQVKLKLNIIYFFVIIQLC